MAMRTVQRSVVALGLLCALPLAQQGARLEPGPIEKVTEEDPKIARRWSNIVAVVEQARPAIVSIDSNVPRPVVSPWGQLLYGPDGRPIMQDQGVSGTGVVIFEDGYIITNNHVVAAGDQVATRIVVRFDQEDDSTQYVATLINQQPEEDLALIKIVGEHLFPTIPLSDAEPLLGETVIAIGNAVGQTHTVSTGIISGLHREISVPGDLGRPLRFRSLIQTDAAINPGNSGGPLLDVNGELVGINTAMSQVAQNIGFAIPAARVRWVLTNHLLAPSNARSYLGCEIDERTFEVRSVLAGGPAEKAGLRVGDRLTSLDGRKLSSEQDYRIARVSLQANVLSNVDVLRGGRPETASIEPWGVIDGVLHERMGVRAETILVGRRYQPWVQLKWVDPGGPAGRVGLLPEDVIRAVQPAERRANQIRDVDTLALLLSRLDAATALDIEIARDEDHDGYLFEESEFFQGKLVLR
jgi:serine protease Do